MALRSEASFISVVVCCNCEVGLVSESASPLEARLVLIGTLHWISMCCSVLHRECLAIVGLNGVKTHTFVTCLIDTRVPCWFLAGLHFPRGIIKLCLHFPFHGYVLAGGNAAAGPRRIRLFPSPIYRTHNPPFPHTSALPSCHSLTLPLISHCPYIVFSFSTLITPISCFHGCQTSSPSPQTALRDILPKLDPSLYQFVKSLPVCPCVAPR